MASERLRGMTAGDDVSADTSEEAEVNDSEEELLEASANCAVVVVLEAVVEKEGDI